MSGKDILEQALKLKPDERFMVVEGLIKSLDEPDISDRCDMGRRSGKEATGVSSR